MPTVLCIVFNVLFWCLCFLYIWMCFKQGRDAALNRENKCTEVVTATISGETQYRLIGCRYYALNLAYRYNDTIYAVRKAWFNNTLPENKQVQLHINPDNPTECYIFTLSEKCGLKPKQNVE